MGHELGTDILIQAPDPKGAAAFYVKELGFEIAHETSNLISIHSPHINLFIERGSGLGPVVKVTAENIEERFERISEITLLGGQMHALRSPNPLPFTSCALSA